MPQRVYLIFSHIWLAWDCGYKQLLEVLPLVPATSHYIPTRAFGVTLWKCRILELGTLELFRLNPYISQMTKLKSREVS